MHLTTEDVNTAFSALVRELDGRGSLRTVTEPSRNGPVIRAAERVLVTYRRPTQRVLFCQGRDANPFFHLFHAMWMLTGRNDAAYPARYAAGVANYSDDGRTLNGAYGHRWRKFNRNPLSCSYCHTQSDDMDARVDQLDVLVAHLRADPRSRRAVLQMWNVEDDLLKIGGEQVRCICQSPMYEGKCDCNGSGYKYVPGSKDVCCNTEVFLDVSFGPCPACRGRGSVGGGLVLETDAALESRPCPSCGGDPGDRPSALNVTVVNRSNDLVWGMLGEDYVTFSVLQEYLAARLGLGVGAYDHFTNNLHAYVRTNSGWHPDRWLAGEDARSRTMHDPRPVSYAEDVRTTVPLVCEPDRFEAELPRFVDDHRGPWTEPFLETVAKPMAVCWEMHKERSYPDALQATSLIWADDWRIACRAWLERRARNWAKRGEGVR